MPSSDHHLSQAHHQLDRDVKQALAAALQQAADLLDPELVRRRQADRWDRDCYAEQLDEIAILLTGTCDQTDIPGLVCRLLRERDRLRRKVIELEAD